MKWYVILLKCDITEVLQDSSEVVRGITEVWSLYWSDVGLQLCYVQHFTEMLGKRFL